VGGAAASAAAALRDDGDAGMNLRRLFVHLATPRWWLLRAFAHGTVKAIEAAIADCERRHRGELRFIVEATLPLAYLLRGLPARERAVELFSSMRVWDTAENSGILIYVQLADRRVEIVADRGIAARVAQGEWDTICRAMENAFGAGDYRSGALTAIRQAEDLLLLHFPAHAGNVNELPDRPLLL
jgi:uncharacterized membrane protein